MNNLVTTAISRIITASDRFGSGLYLAHSGGKDSCIIYELTRMANVTLPIVHSVKADTHPATFALVERLQASNTVHFIYAGNEEEFLKAKGLTCQVDGTRRDECTRTEKSDNYVEDGKTLNRQNMPDFVENGLFGVSLVYPIVDWLEHDVWAFIREHNITVSAEYTNV